MENLIYGKNAIIEALESNTREFNRILISNTSRADEKVEKIKELDEKINKALEENEKTIYIFDGQQRTFTLYNILKYCGESDLKQYKFVGRDINNENEYGSPYSKESVEQLYKVLKNNKIDKKGFAEYIKNKLI